MHRIRSRHGRSYAASPGPVTHLEQVAHSRAGRRQPLLERRAGRAARGGPSPGPRRGDCRPAPRQAQPAPRHPLLSGDGDRPHDGDRRRLRGCRRPRCAAPRSGADDRLRACAGDRPFHSEPADPLAPGEPGRHADAVSDRHRLHRSVLPQLRPPAGIDRARHRRHRRHGARPAGAGAVQYPRRRPRLEADSHLRGGLGQADPVAAAAGQAAVGRGDRARARPRHPSHPPAMAASGHSGARRRPLLRAGSARSAA